LYNHEYFPLQKFPRLGVRNPEEEAAGVGVKAVLDRNRWLAASCSTRHDGFRGGLTHFDPLKMDSTSAAYRRFAMSSGLLICGWERSYTIHWDTT